MSSLQQLSLIPVDQTGVVHKLQTKCSDEFAELGTSPHQEVKRCIY